jgi:catechol 2,3-dioxygenase-like lactoylglutathione lyase family enzyme
VRVLAIDHVNLVCRPDEEAATLAFWREVMGLEELAKPPGRRRQGGWFRLGDRALHLSVDADAPAPRGHVALRVASLAEAEAALRAAGAVLADPRPPRDGSARLFARDPAGNRIELLGGVEPR